MNLYLTPSTVLGTNVGLPFDSAQGKLADT